MTTFTPGQPVTVHIGGIDNDPTGHEGEYRGEAPNPLYLYVVIAGKQVGYWHEWVVPVTPPCPWTEPGTVVITEPLGGAPGWGALFRLNSSGWYYVGGDRAEWAKDIAPYNPRRLVPEQPAYTFRDVSGELWYSVGTERLCLSDYAEPWRSVEERHGPLTVVDDPAVAS